MGLSCDWVIVGHVVLMAMTLYGFKDEHVYILSFSNLFSITAVVHDIYF